MTRPLLALMAVLLLTVVGCDDSKPEAPADTTAETTAGTPAATTPATTPSVYYRSCDDAPGPLRKGDPGYRPGLDRDGDGIACDK